VRFKAGQYRLVSRKPSELAVVYDQNKFWGRWARSIGNLNNIPHLQEICYLLSYKHPPHNYWAFNQWLGLRLKNFAWARNH